MARLVFALSLVVALAVVFIAAAPAQQEDEDYTHHRVECSARSNIFPTSGNSLMATSRSRCDRLTQALSIDADIYREDPYHDSLYWIGSYGNSCVVCPDLNAFEEEFGLSPGRYAVHATHRMTVHGEDASITSYSSTMVP